VGERGGGDLKRDELVAGGGDEDGVTHGAGGGGRKGRSGDRD
jgi:hypothetical protein